MRTPRTLLLPALVACALALALSLGACGGGAGDGGATDDVASLGGGEATTTTAAAGGGGGAGPQQNPVFEDAMLDFARCMREHGIDFPDPQTDGNGLTVVGGGIGGPGSGPPTQAERDELEAAQTACQPIMDAAQAQMPTPDPEQLAEMHDDALAFARCMRQHGVDMPDPTFDDNGGAAIQIGSADGDGPSTGPAFDPSDPDFRAAQDTCGRAGGFVTSSNGVGDDG